MRIVLGNQRLEQLIESIQTTLFVDTPNDLMLAANYLTRATRALLGGDDNECAIYDSEVMDTLEQIVNDFLGRLDMRFANVDLYGESCDPYDFFLILEINDGCFRQSKHSRYRELLALRENTVAYQNQFQRM